MSNPNKQHGSFSWNELMTSDVNGAKNFYAAMFNWQYEDIDSAMPYTLAKIDGNDSAGIMTIPPDAKGMPPMWGGYVSVDDVGKSAKQATELGATIIMPPTDIPNVGRFCVIADPQGAMLSIITFF